MPSFTRVRGDSGPGGHPGKGTEIRTALPLSHPSPRHAHSERDHHIISTGPPLPFRLSARGQPQCAGSNHGLASQQGAMMTGRGHPSRIGFVETMHIYHGIAIHTSTNSSIFRAPLISPIRASNSQQTHFSHSTTLLRLPCQDQSPTLRCRRRSRPEIRVDLSQPSSARQYLSIRRCEERSARIPETLLLLRHHCRWSTVDGRGEGDVVFCSKHVRLTRRQPSCPL